MKIIHWILLVFFLVPLAEIYILIEVGSIVGSLNIILFIVGTIIAGVILLRSRGFSCLHRTQACLRHGQLPALAIAEELMLAFAGTMLIFPGFLTDTIGIICLISPLRRRVLKQALDASLRVRAPYSNASKQPHTEILEGEYKREDD